MMLVRGGSSFNSMVRAMKQSIVDGNNATAAAAPARRTSYSGGGAVGGAGAAGVPHSAVPTVGARPGGGSRLVQGRAPQVT